MPENCSHAITNRNSIGEREDVEAHDVIYITSSCDFLRFASFILKSRFNEDNNLKLAYLLIHAQFISLANAASILKISRALFYMRILPENSCFLSAKKSVHAWGQGGQERRIKLSKEALEFSELIERLAEHHLGETECQRLRIEAAKARRKIVEHETKYQRRLNELKKKRGHPNFNIFVLTAAKDFKKTREEVLADLGGGEDDRDDLYIS